MIVGTWLYFFWSRDRYGNSKSDIPEYSIQLGRKDKNEGEELSLILVWFDITVYRSINTINNWSPYRRGLLVQKSSSIEFSHTSHSISSCTSFLLRKGLPSVYRYRRRYNIYKYTTLTTENPKNDIRVVNDEIRDCFLTCPGSNVWIYPISGTLRNSIGIQPPAFLHGWMDGYI